MKKHLLVLLSVSLVFTLCVSPSVEAKDFSNEEEKYMKLCSSNKMSRSTYKTCKEFNAYLKDKNEDLADSIQDTKDSISKAKDNLDDVSDQIDTINAKISKKEKEIQYLEKSIKKLEKEIKEKNTTVKNRMYSMQSYTNTNMYIEFIFGASDFTDLFSRIQSVDELTSYDKQLIAELKDDKKQVKQQQETVKTAKANLESQKKEQEELQEQYEKAVNEYTATLQSQKDSQSSNSSNSTKVSKALEESLKEFYKEAAKPSESGTVIQGSSGNASTGASIANYALSKVGCPYVWGATGPNSFDCSGLVCWAFAQAGHSIGRATSHTLATMGTSVSSSNLQAGDVIVFSSNGKQSGVHHVGIYIGGGKMVHAPCTGQNVKVQTITSGYYARQFYTARRIY